MTLETDPKIASDNPAGSLSERRMGFQRYWHDGMIIITGWRAYASEYARGLILSLGLFLGFDVAIDFRQDEFRGQKADQR